jgi:hypothetical protein
MAFGRATAASKNCTWTPTDSLVGKIESSLEMPQKLSLQSYRRYYSGEVVKNRHVVVGVFLKSDHPGIEIVPESMLPRILDGGCSVVTLHYDVSTQKVITLRCNGVG